MNQRHSALYFIRLIIFLFVSTSFADTNEKIYEVPMELISKTRASSLAEFTEVDYCKDKREVTKLGLKDLWESVQKYGFFCRGRQIRKLSPESIEFVKQNKSTIKSIVKKFEPHVSPELVATIIATEITFSNVFDKAIDIIKEKTKIPGDFSMGPAQMKISTATKILKEYGYPFEDERTVVNMLMNPNESILLVTMYLSAAKKAYQKEMAKYPTIYKQEDPGEKILNLELCMENLKSTPQIIKKTFSSDQEDYINYCLNEFRISRSRSTGFMSRNGVAWDHFYELNDQYIHPSHYHFTIEQNHEIKVLSYHYWTGQLRIPELMNQIDYDYPVESINDYGKFVWYHIGKIYNILNE